MNWEVTKLQDANDNTYSRNIGCQQYVYDLLHSIIEFTKGISMWLMCASTECKQFQILHIQQSMGCIVPSFQSECIGRCYCGKSKSVGRCHFLKMAVNDFWHWVMIYPLGYVVTVRHNRTIGRLSIEQWSWQHFYYVLKMSVNWASTIFGLASWKLHGLCGDIKP